MVPCGPIDFPLPGLSFFDCKAQISTENKCHFFWLTMDHYFDGNLFLSPPFRSNSFQSQSDIPRDFSQSLLLKRQLVGLYKWTLFILNNIKKIRCFPPFSGLQHDGKKSVHRIKFKCTYSVEKWRLWISFIPPRNCVE